MLFFLILPGSLTEWTTECSSTRLRDLGICGLLGACIHSFLTDRSQIVATGGATGGATASPSPVLSAVPQGSVLGPLLFLIYIMDIDEHVTHSTVASFADDTRILMPLSTSVAAGLLQDDLAHLYTWASENNMSFNNSKFEHLAYSVFSRPDALTNIYRSLTSCHIKTTPSVRDLGVSLSFDANFSAHIAAVTNSARSQAG